MAQALLGAEAPRQPGVQARPEIPLPASKSLAPETPVEATVNPEPDR